MFWKNLGQKWVRQTAPSDAPNGPALEPPPAVDKEGANVNWHVTVEFTTTQPLTEDNTFDILEQLSDHSAAVWVFPDWRGGSTNRGSSRLPVAHK